MGISKNVTPYGTTVYRVTVRVNGIRYQRQFPDTEEGYNQAIEKCNELLEKQRIEREKRNSSFQLHKRSFKKVDETRLSGVYLYKVWNKQHTKQYMRMHANPMFHSKFLFTMTRVVHSVEEVEQFIRDYINKLPNKQKLHKKHITEFQKKFIQLEREVRLDNESIPKRRKV